MLTTRASADQVAALRDAFGDAVDAGTLGGTVMVGRPALAYDTPIPIVCAGTSDLPVAEEAAMTCRALGHPVHASTTWGWRGCTG